MRQNTPRRPPEKRGASATGAVGHPLLDGGDHLDLGITVTVYCAEAARLHAARHDAATDTPGTAAPDTGTCFTEH
jgi:hypothetical protein